MKRWVAGLLALALACASGGALAAGDTRVRAAYSVEPYRGGLAIFTTMEDFRCGLADPAGRVAVEPQWDALTWISDDYLAAYTHDAGHWGVIDRTGAYVSPTHWDGVIAREGYALLQKGERYAILSADGRQLGDPAWTDVTDVGEGVCAARRPEGGYAFVNVTTGAVSEAAWQAYRPYANGYAAVRGEGGWTYLNTAMQPICEDAWPYASDFYNDRAVVRTAAGQSLLIDETGATLMTATDYDAAEVAYEPYYDEDMGVYGYRDGSGTVIEPRFRQAHAFASGLALVQYREAYGFINARGRLTLPNSWTAAEDFVGRYAAVSDGFFTGYIDEENRLYPTYPALCKTLEDASLLVMESGGRQYLADADMRIFTQTGYDEIVRVSGGRVLVADHTDANFAAPVYGLISLRGESVLLPTWDEITPFANGLAKVRKGVNYGLINPDGELVVEAKYQYIGDWTLSQIPVFIGTITESGAPLKGKYGFIAADGADIGKPSWDYAEPYACGVALVFSGKVDEATGRPLEGKYGYVNEAGEAVLPPLWTRAASFDGNRAAVYLDGQWLGIAPDGTQAY